MSTGEPIRVRAAMKPFSTVPRPLATVDLATGEPAVAIKQRTDVCAVPAGGVVGEAVVAFELANAVLEKFGGDSLPETRAEPRALPGDAAVIVYLVGMPGAGQVRRSDGSSRGVSVCRSSTSTREIERRAGPAGRRDLRRARARRRSARWRRPRSRRRARTTPSVVACGGGVVLEPANRIALRNTGTVRVPRRAARAAPRARAAGGRAAPDPAGGRPRAAARRARARSTGSSPRTSSTAAATPGEVADAIVEELRWSA